MKKRGQPPNAQTYTILFRGFAKSQHPTLAVSEAVRIYTTMLDSPRLPLNTIHLNAVLEVCARARRHKRHVLKWQHDRRQAAKSQFRHVRNHIQWTAGIGEYRPLPARRSSTLGGRRGKYWKGNTAGKVSLGRGLRKWKRRNGIYRRAARLFSGKTSAAGKPQ